MTFTEYMASRQTAMPSPPWLTQTAAILASPGKHDTRRAIDRATRRGRTVTPDDLKASISPESHEKARDGLKPVQHASPWPGRIRPQSVGLDPEHVEGASRDEHAPPHSPPGPSPRRA